MQKDNQNESEVITEQVKTESQKQSFQQSKKKFKIDKKYVYGFLAGVLFFAIVFTGIAMSINPDFLKGTFTKQIGEIALQHEVDMIDTITTPDSLNASSSIESVFILDVPIDKLNNINKDDIYLWGFFKDMEVTDLTKENGKLKVKIKGTPLETIAYDSDTKNEDGYISIFGDAVKDQKIGYTATVSITYPRLASVPERLEENDAYDTDLTLTLEGDTFSKTPTSEDITLSGMFKDMEISNLSQKGSTLSFHISGASSTSGYSGHIEVSKDVLNSGFSAQRIIQVDGTPTLYSITPITVEAPFEDTLILRISNDYYIDTITPDMFTLGGDLSNANISKIEYIDNMNIYITLCGYEIREKGTGTITLSSEGLQSKRSVTAEIPIEDPSIFMNYGNDELLTAAPGQKIEYKLTVFSKGNDFMPYLTSDDFVLKDALSEMQVLGVEWINGYKVELTLKGELTVGTGIISVRTAALGDVKGAECSVKVTDSIEFSGRVNLTNILPEMTISFCDKDGVTLNIPTTTTDKYGNFFATITSEMPFTSIAFVKAKNSKMELRAPFNWMDRECININAFTTIMEDIIAISTTDEEGIQKVYKYLELDSLGLPNANYSMHGKNAYFSHELFEKQANGDVNGYIKKLEDEIKSGKTRSFAETNELSGQTGGLLSDFIDWGIDKIKETAIAGIKSAVVEGSQYGFLYILRKSGIIGPSTTQMLENLQSSVDALSVQVQIMESRLTQEIKEVELQGMLNNLKNELNIIINLNAKYLNRKEIMEYEIAAYKANHPNKTDPLVASELSKSIKFFGSGGTVEGEKLDLHMRNIIGILNGQGVGTSLISLYYDVLKGKLPFEINACEDMHNFINYVTIIETTGLQLYSAYCLFYDDPALRLDLEDIEELYADSIEAQLNGSEGIPALLPSSNVFSVKKCKGEETVTVRCNYNGKYYTFPYENWIMKDKVAITMGRDTKLGFYSFDRSIDNQAFDDIFYYWQLYYSKDMTPKEYLTKYGGCVNLPDWLIYDYTNPFCYYIPMTWNYQVTFYDISDNVYRTYYASDLYVRYSDWHAKRILTYDE